MNSNRNTDYIDYGDYAADLYRASSGFIQLKPGTFGPPSGTLGFQHGRSSTPLYRTWQNMLARCGNKKMKNYPHYGGRGITVCSQWQTSFAQFALDAFAAGYKPGLWIDRIDANGNYEPSNVRWVTQQEQARNMRKTCFIEAFGERKSASEWAEDSRCSVSRNVLCMRIKYGWAPEAAVTTASCQGKRPGNAVREDQKDCLPSTA